MTFQEKFDYYVEALAEVDPSHDVPLLWQLMWRMGIKIPPQEFINPVILFLGLTFSLSILWFPALSIVLLVISWQQEIALAIFSKLGLYIVVPANAIAAFVVALGAVSDRQKHGFGSWSEFGEGRSPP